MNVRFGALDKMKIFDLIKTIKTTASVYLNFVKKELLIRNVFGESIRNKLLIYSKNK